MTILTVDFAWLHQIARGKPHCGEGHPVGNWPAFDLADVMELGLSKELTSQYAAAPPEERTRQLTVTRSQETSEHVLLCENQLPLLMARPSASAEDEPLSAIDIFVPCDGATPVALGPAFRLTHCEKTETFELCSLRCEHHEFKPAGDGRPAGGRRVLFRATQEGYKVGKGRLLKIEAVLPKAGDVCCNCGRAGEKRIEINDGIVLPSMMPKYNKRTRGLTLNFGPRCTKAHIRNFQLSGSEGDCVLMHGQTATGDFALDFKTPLGPVQAFALALTTTHWK